MTPPKLQIIVLLLTAIVLLLPNLACSEQPEQFLHYYLYDDFRRHPAKETYTGTPASIDLSSHAQARQ